MQRKDEKKYFAILKQKNIPDTVMLQIFHNIVLNSPCKEDSF